VEKGEMAWGGRRGLCAINRTKQNSRSAKASKFGGPARQNVPKETNGHRGFTPFQGATKMARKWNTRGETR